MGRRHLSSNPVQALALIAIMSGIYIGCGADQKPRRSPQDRSPPGSTQASTDEGSKKGAPTVAPKPPTPTPGQAPSAGQKDETKTIRDGSPANTDEESSQGKDGLATDHLTQDEGTKNSVSVSVRVGKQLCKKSARDFIDYLGEVEANPDREADFDIADHMAVEYLAASIKTETDVTVFKNKNCQSETIAKAEKSGGTLVSVNIGGWRHRYVYYKKNGRCQKKKKFDD